jgi:ubiquinone/menaquinone biosynthesis C-methylase UbiE
LTIRDSREWVCRQASGRTLEVGVGTGLNFRWYPGDVDLVAVEMDRERLEVCPDRAREQGRAVRLAVADGHRLPFDHDTFDTVVCTLAICDVDDREATLAEDYRVVRPGGSLLLLDHFESRWRHGRPAMLAEQVGFTLVESSALVGGVLRTCHAPEAGRVRRVASALAGMDLGRTPTHTSRTRPRWPRSTWSNARGA